MSWEHLRKRNARTKTVSARDVVCELHAIFRGRVQGVGFRITTCEVATRCGVFGTVRNLSDGSVEVVAQGTREALEKFQEKLAGNAAGRVDTVEASFRDVEDVFTDFQII